MQRPLPVNDYYAIVTRNEERSMGNVYSWRLRQPLPVLPVPLRSPDSDVLIDLQAVFQGAFEFGTYVKSLHYGESPRAPLRDEDQAWAAQLLAQRNRSKASS